jgi:hypothetical protein
MVDPDDDADVSTEMTDWSRIENFIDEIEQEDDLSEIGDIESNNREIL